MTQMGREAALIYNPESGGRKSPRRLTSLLEQLERHGVVAEPKPTRFVGHATELAREALERGVDLVVGWGGDGTLNEIAQAMVGAETPLGIIPGGTVNVFARETGIPLGLRGASRSLATGEATAIPVGTANERPFLLMAGVGIDGEVVHRLDSSFKKRFGTLAFWIHGLSLLWSYPFEPLMVRVDGHTYEGTSLVAGKLRRYGTGYFITPDARVREPWLDVVLFQGRHGRDYLRYLFGVAVGVHLRFKDVQHFKTSSLEVASTTGRQLYHVDGERGGKLPVRLGIVRDGLRVVLPRRDEPEKVGGIST